MEPNEWLLEHYWNRLNSECFSGDEEHDHYVADDLLCQLLIDLGYEKIVEKFKEVHKWYA